MKIKRISLSNDEYYGHFSGRDFEFDTGSLVVVHGANESGKSTFLNLVRDLLFGIRNNSAYQWGDVPKKMQMQMRALLELQGATPDAAPRRLEITRRKGTKNVLTGRFEDGEPLDEAGFKKRLNLPDRDEYENVFGFTQAILNADPAAEKNSPLAQVLYSTAFRAGGVNELKKQLRDEADNCFTPQGRTKEVQVRAAKIAELLDELGKAGIDRRQYAELEDRLKTQAEEIERLERDCAVKTREYRRLEKLQKSRAHYLAMKHARSRLTEIDQSDDRAAKFPTGGRAEYQNLRNTIAESKKTIGGNAEQIAQSNREIDLHRQQCRNDVLKISLPLHGLNNRQSGYESRLRQLDEKRDKLGHLEGKIDALLKRLDPGATRETVAATFVTDALLAELENMQSQEREHANRMTAEKSKLELHERQLTESEAERIRITESCDETPLRDADRHRIAQFVDGLPQYENACVELQKRLLAAERQRQDIAALREKLVQRLGLAEAAGGEFDVLRHFPDDALIRGFEKERNTIDEQLAKRENAIAECDERLAACELEIRKLDTETGKPPTFDEIRQQREQRDNLWRRIRRRYDGKDDDAFDEPAEDAAAPDRFERLVQNADAMADLRFDRVNEVRRLEELLKERDSLRRRLETLRSEQAEMQKRFDVGMAEWLAIWPGCRPELVKLPAVMLDLRRDWNDWREKTVRLRDAESEITLLQTNRAEYERRADELASDLIELVGEGGGFERTLLHGEQGWETPEIKAFCAALKAAVERQSERQRLLSQCEQDIAKSRAARDAAQTTWREANDTRESLVRQSGRLLANAGLPTDGSIDAMQARCRLVRQIREEMQNTEREQIALSDAETQIRQFEAEIAAVLHDVPSAAEAVSLAPSERLAHAVRLLEGSETASQQIRILEAQVALLERKNLSEEQNLSNRRAELQSLFEKTGVTEDDEFAQLADLAETRTRHVNEIEHARGQLVTILETPDIASWETELEHRFGHDVTAGTSAEPGLKLEDLLEKLSGEIEQLNETLKQLRESKGGSDAELRRLRQSDGAAETAEKIEFARQELAESIHRYLPRLLALKTLEYSIEKFEREQQPETLRQIQRYFSDMTAGRYMRVGTPVGGLGELFVEERGGTVKDVPQLSTGTREQLFLAMRLAYIDNFRKNREPLPVVLDDVLVNFDPARQKETLRFLGDLSRHIQVILLTCHDATLELAREAVPTLQQISL